MLKIRKCKLDTSCLHLENTAERSNLKAVVYRTDSTASIAAVEKKGRAFFGSN